MKHHDQQERALDAMPPEPPALANLPEGPAKDAVRAIRAEYGALAIRNARRIRAIQLIAVGGTVALSLLLCGIAVWNYVLTGRESDTATTALSAARGAHNAVSGVQVGRRVSLGVTCAVQSAIAQAGRDTITAQVREPPPAAEEQALERLGFPPFAVRKRQAIAEADQYVRSIAGSVEAQVGHRGDRLINKRTGGIDCSQLAKIARVPGP